MELVLLVIPWLAVMALGVWALLGRAARPTRVRGQRSTSPEEFDAATRLWWSEIEEPVPRTAVSAQNTYRPT